MSGMLASRIASHALAACSSSAFGRALAGWGPRRSASTAAAEDGSAPTPTLTPEQQQRIPELLAQLQRTTAAAQQLAAVTHLSVTYRDLSVAMSALRMRQRGLDPITDNYAELTERAPAAADSSKDGAEAVGAAAPGTYLPLRDVAAMDPELQVDGVSKAPDHPVYDPKYMDKISCWAALQPNHIEMSQQLMTGIKLFPPTEASYPTFVDFDAALRKLSLHVSRKRLRLNRRLLRKQDKYQLKTWEHSPGEA